MGDRQETKPRHRITEPWWFTDRIVRKYLEKAKPFLVGRVLDAGCGHQPYRNEICCEEYVGIEISAEFAPDFVGDLRNMNMFRDEEFDSVFSSQVLEHVDDVDAVLAEFHRVLRVDGHLCLTLPFISRLHGRPHDYWRFSEFGVRVLFKRHGFEEVLIAPMGGFITTQAFLWLFYVHEKCQRFRLTRLLGRLFALCVNPLALLLHQFDRDETTAFNYVAVGRKTQDEPCAPKLENEPEQKE